MKKKTTITDFLRKYSVDASYKAVREGAKKATGAEKAKFESQQKQAIKSLGGLPGIVDKRSLRSSLKNPSPEKERQLKEIEIFRTFLGKINAAYRHLPSNPENKGLKDVKIDVEDLIRRMTDIVDHVYLQSKKM